MSPEPALWNATHRHLQLTIRDYGCGRYQILVSDGTLTHLHPTTCPDLDSARASAYEHAVRFVALGSAQGVAEAIRGLEWEHVEPRQALDSEQSPSTR